MADGVEDYFMGAGEAPGVWHGRWNPVHEWLKASETIFLSELQRHLTDRRRRLRSGNATAAGLVGFTPEQRWAFSKRTAAIETV